VQRRPHTGPDRRAAHVAHFKLSTAVEVQKREADLATRKKYLTNFWYAASFSKDISYKRPVRTKLLDTTVLIWRDDATGGVVCVTATDPETQQEIPEDVDISLEQQSNQEGVQETAMCVLTAASRHRAVQLDLRPARNSRPEAP
jgi:hypothetical protein